MRLDAKERFYPWLCLLVLVLLSWRVSAADVTIYAPDEPQALHIAEDIGNSLNSSYEIETDFKSVQQHASSLIITIGNSTFSNVAESRLTTPTIGAYVFRYIVDEARSEHANKPLSAVYSDSNPLSQLNLAQNLLPDANLLFLYTNQTQSYAQEMAEEANRRNINLHVEAVGKGKTLRAVNGLIKRKPFDLLILSTDKSLYDKQTLSLLLQTLYHRRKGTIGISKKLVAAGGSVGATFFNYEDIAFETIRMVNDYLSVGQLSEPRYPSKESSDINKNYLRTVFNQDWTRNGENHE